MNAPELLDRHYLEVRARLLEIAATLDRIERGEGETGHDARMQQIHQGIQILLAPEGEESGSRAERIQHLFSFPYQTDWRKSLDV